MLSDVTSIDKNKNNSGDGFLNNTHANKFIGTDDLVSINTNNLCKSVDFVKHNKTRNEAASGVFYNNPSLSEFNY